MKASVENLRRALFVHGSTVPARDRDGKICPVRTGLNWNLLPVRSALGFSWQSPPSAVASHSPDSRVAQRHGLAIRRRLSTNRNQTNPRCVTHSAVVLSSRQPRGTVHLSRLSSGLANRVKTEGARSREKCEQGGGAGIPQGAMRRKGTEYARCKAFPWLGTEEGFAHTTSGRKGFAMPACWSGYVTGDAEGEADAA